MCVCVVWCRRRIYWKRAPGGEYVPAAPCSSGVMFETSHLVLQPGARAQLALKVPPWDRSTTFYGFRPWRAFAARRRLHRARARAHMAIRTCDCTALQHPFRVYCGVAPGRSEFWPGRFGPGGLRAGGSWEHQKPEAASAGFVKRHLTVAVLREGPRMCRVGHWAGPPPSHPEAGGAQDWACWLPRNYAHKMQMIGL